MLRDITTLRARVKLLQEEIAAQVDEGNNERLFVPTIVTLPALPIDMIAGPSSMNVGRVPLAQHARGVWIVAAIVFMFMVIAGWIRRGVDASAEIDTKRVRSRHPRRVLTLPGPAPWW